MLIGKKVTAMRPRQFGFFFDAERCVQCHACELACKAMHNVELGVRWRRVLSVWGGEYPRVWNRGVSLACMNCSDPPCVKACPKGAIEKRPDDGGVLVDQDKCIGCRCCFWVCPFGVPQFGVNGKMQKCQACIDRFAPEKDPPCVATCPAEALLWGTMDTLTERVAKKNVAALFPATHSFSTVL